MSDIEYRVAKLAPNAPAEGNRLFGRAISFNSQTMIGKAPWGFREQVNPKACSNTLSDDDQVLLDNHDSARPLARASAGTLELHPGRKGLDWQATAADTSYARDVLANVRAGNYGGCSFGFEVVSDTWDESSDDGIPLRTLNEIKLREISIVTFPAYGDTTVSARSAVEAAMESRWNFYEREIMEWRADHELRDPQDGDGPGKSKAPYGDVPYADPGYQKDGKKRYPIDTKEHVKAAWSYINQSKNSGKYTSEQLAHIKGKIKAAAKKFGVEISSDEKNSELIVVEARDGITINFDSELWNEEARSRYLNEEKWIDVLTEGSEGEPSRLTREETVELSTRAARFRQEQYAKRKALMSLEGKK